MKINAEVTVVQSNKHRILDSTEAEYWKTLLFRSLKIGMEIEADMPGYRNDTYTDSCSGRSLLCPCVNDNGCSKECLLVESCKLSRWPERCQMFADNKCTNVSNVRTKSHSALSKILKSCAECSEWKFLCSSTQCVQFTSPCINCTRLGHNCEKCTLKTQNLNKHLLSASKAREEISKELRPSNFVGIVGETGVLVVTSDGSLSNGGVEIPTVGRRIDFYTYFNMLSRIFKACQDYGAVANEKCGLHMHMLVGHLENLQYLSGSDYMKADSFRQAVGRTYSLNDLEVPMPEIILANFHQIICRYTPALVWLTSAGSSFDALTRWANFRHPITKQSAINQNMSAIRSNHDRYGFVQYIPTVFNSSNDITRLHLEARYADGAQSAAAVSAWACLLGAMMIKAADISKYGVITRGDAKRVAEDDDLITHILTNDSDYSDRRSHTNIRPYIPKLVERSRELLTLVKRPLLQMRPAYEILKQLTEAPVSVRRAEGKNWQQIDDDLMSQVTKKDTPLELSKVIDLMTIQECGNVDEWISAVATHLSTPLEEITSHVQQLISEDTITWSNDLGAFVMGK